ncbi:hypothetical protein SBA1_870009 [Candidatus Sulfotelmatobacter kueseliae]|uniref:Uncharacterized protein n=1 Tax=Candidatus Sulfotelmatobacter kueseliae TaxID=2042962 RepID=A0A2U3L9T8_9BACT|nr:hypothetical protein SBA1_870009 [Candidatus Sulfotelmatobacter kueseliae]
MHFQCDFGIRGKHNPTLSARLLVARNFPTQAKGRLEWATRRQNLPCDGPRRTDLQTEGAEQDCGRMQAPDSLYRAEEDSS